MPVDVEKMMKLQGDSNSSLSHDCRHLDKMIVLYNYLSSSRCRHLDTSGEGNNNIIDGWLGCSGSYKRFYSFTSNKETSSPAYSR
ncbi:hypothetical protein PV326_006416 [Microctonus aethiopoides]|nr:hypothetical protein PV326_006416 [Microctonus aethiopoides]